MAEKSNYYGDFEHDITYADFDKTTLLRLLSIMSEYVQKVDGFWYVAVMNREGDDAAYEMDRWIWEKLQIWDIRKFTGLFEIEGNNVEALAKYFQIMPWAPINPRKIELRGKNHAIITFTDCPMLKVYEKEGAGREMRMCHEWEHDIMRRIADYFNPDISVRALKLPPRKDSSGVCCQWEFRLQL